MRYEQKSKGDLKKELEKLKSGEHLCGIYKNKKQKFMVAILFLLVGLKNNQKCIYILDESSKEEVIHVLKEQNVNVKEHLSSKQLELSGKEDTYLKKNYFDPEKMIKLLNRAEKEAIKDGYRGLRVIGEMDWVLAVELPEFKRLIEYEVKLNYFFPRSRSLAICQYNERKFPPEILLHLIRTHPKIIIYETVCKNPYYIPPDESLTEKEEKIPQAIYERVKSAMIERRGYKKELQQNLTKLKRTLEGIIHALASVVEARDPYTAGHQERVTNIACAIAKQMDLTEERIEGIRVAGMLHDIGKINIPSEILSRPARLTKVESSMIETHPITGYDILKEIDFPWPIAKIVLQHHERINGSGYPAGIAGERILLEARILAVADVVEAMSSHRPYRPALGIDKALEEIEKNKGKLYCPRVVDACIKISRRIATEYPHPLPRP